MVELPCLGCISAMNRDSTVVAYCVTEDAAVLQAEGRELSVRVPRLVLQLTYSGKVDQVTSTIVFAERKIDQDSCHGGPDELEEVQHRLAVTQRAFRHPLASKGEAVSTRTGSCNFRVTHAVHSYSSGHPFMRVHFVGSLEPFSDMRLEKRIQFERKLFTGTKFFPQMDETCGSLVETKDDICLCPRRWLVEELQFREEQRELFREDHSRREQPTVARVVDQHRNETNWIPGL